MASLADTIVTDDSGSASFPGNSETARKALTQAVLSQGSETQESTESGTGKSILEQTLTDGVPDKFKGKSVKDILDSYANLESRNGHMANELGTQRQLTDRLLDLKRDGDLSKNGAQQAPVRQKLEVTAADILDKPAETLDRVIAQREQDFTRVVDQRLQRLEMNNAENAFKQRHSDFQDVVTGQKFGDWVRSSPIRLRAAAAANQGNWQIADELLTEFKGSSQSADGATTSTSTTRTADLDGARKATLDSSGGRSSDGAQKTQVTYKRTDLMRLRIEDPEAYYDEAFQDLILKAHAEKRVI